MITASTPDLAGRLELHRAGRDWRGACPACGYADAFVLSERDGRRLGWCASCGPDGQPAIGRLLRGEGDAVARVERPPEDTARAVQRQAAAAALWRRAVPCAGTFAENYLVRRHLPALAASPALRFLGDCPHPGGGRLPAMLAAVTAPAGHLAGVHRTFLAPGGRKAAVEPSRATLGAVSGGTVRLAGYDTPPALVIGEGIETSSSAGVLLGLPAWAAISAGNLARGVILPTEVREVVVAADPDQPGEEAALAAAARWRMDGRRVRIARTGRPGVDFNDVLAEQRNA